MPKFAKGSSGNPAGRPPSHKKIGQLRALIGKYAEPVIKRLIKLAVEEGDAVAARILVERCVPAIKPVELPAKLPPLPDGLAARATALLDYTVTGLLSPSQGVALISAMAILGKIVETDSLIQRMEAAEAAIQAQQQTPALPSPAAPPEPAAAHAQQQPEPEPTAQTLVELAQGETLVDVAEALGIEVAELQSQIADGLVIILPAEEPS